MLNRTKKDVRTTRRKRNGEIKNPKYRTKEHMSKEGMRTMWSARRSLHPLCAEVL